jgi:NAD(P)-dependent dehydrogenase (short-subunit alcohol dehydrogenase family)
MGKVVLITGASAGMGREAAILMAQNGHTVYAGARRADRLAELATGGVIPVEMDVSVGADNERAVNQVIEGEGRIDVLINNAGFGLYGPVEDIPLDDARYQFEVNLFGLAHLTQLALPHMRAQGSGRIVNISSVGGRVYLPLGAWYIATKHALEGWSDCLRLETAPFGIQVVLIEPGAIRTEFADVAGAPLENYRGDTAYSGLVGAYIRMRDNPRTMHFASHPKVLAKVYLKAATARRPRRHYVKGALGRPALIIREWLGDGVYEFLLRRIVR